MSVQQPLGRARSGMRRRICIDVQTHLNGNEHDLPRHELVQILTHCRAEQHIGLGQIEIITLRATADKVTEP